MFDYVKAHGDVEIINFLLVSTNICASKEIKILWK